MSTPATNANIPQPSAPFLVGRPEPISQVWWAFLLALFQRTGGTGTPDPVTGTSEAELIYAQAIAPLFAPQDAPGTVSFIPSLYDEAPGPVAVPNFASDPVEDIFVSGTGFTPGTTTSLTLSKPYTVASAVMVHFDASFQGSDQYTVSGKTITFSSAIPVGVSRVYARG